MFSSFIKNLVILFKQLKHLLIHRSLAMRLFH
uniref:Uncharacterized protein n=1 Tax=Myoviridae sp. ctCo31 TaxID=2825053 RepID=A0A8S5UMI1_9CAUD|nr:MAG TPA: hypothetical protein [Myoviridae sp. ctCo31]